MCGLLGGHWFWTISDLGKVRGPFTGNLNVATICAGRVRKDFIEGLEFFKLPPHLHFHCTDSLLDTFVGLSLNLDHIVGSLHLLLII